MNQGSGAESWFVNDFPVESQDKRFDFRMKFPSFCPFDAVFYRKTHSLVGLQIIRSMGVAGTDDGAFVRADFLNHRNQNGLDVYKRQVKAGI